MSLTLTTQDKITLRTAAYGAVTLLASADAAGSPHKAATAGSLALYSATGPVGHVLAEKKPGVHLEGKTVAAMADHVLPALTASMTLLTQQDPAVAGEFRHTVLVAVDAAARSHRGEPSPTAAEMTRKITAALDAA
ncbi:hypothetical protein [Streptosporangium roseum]|uniref:D-alanyl-D-alanine carboxypeptidase n=1 Tax=Streptosporangium roseum (strain ATCC 12428 / DSM 43021 / JCM 3005 / KCTC 9067 / NCIMB 10171 / NRRL 2505 / NI 9100) TaxID=479432 RepID=D2B083_STRRD|nr:hypothetical protein [Streptosporangium roseum]ACZ89089.1 hypothetical protein Sros_6370 [Streptosporangium roseum DSM 43021]